MWNAKASTSANMASVPTTTKHHGGGADQTQPPPDGNEIGADRITVNIWSLLHRFLLRTTGPVFITGPFFVPDKLLKLLRNKDAKKQFSPHANSLFPSPD